MTVTENKGLKDFSRVDGIVGERLELGDFRKNLAQISDISVRTKKEVTDITKGQQEG